MLLLALSTALSAEVLLVHTPGAALEAHATLHTALTDAGHAVHTAGFPCSGTSADLAGAVERAGEALGEGYVVVAHGLGATIALRADLEASRYVLLAPVLGAPVVEAAKAAAHLETLDLRVATPWRGRDLREALLGTPLPPLTCLSPQLAREVQGWVRAGSVPVALEEVGAPVWVGVGLLDELAPPEVLVAASRRIPERTLVRLGITRLDPRDFGHAAMLVDPIPARAAAGAVAP